MNYKDLKELVEKIELDSQERDHIFYLGKGKDKDEQRHLFFKYVREVKHYMDYYLENEETVMKEVQ